MRGIIVIVVLGLVGCTPGPDASPMPSGPFSKLIVFGDSISDTGNLSVQTLGNIPGPPNYQGRFSNGPLWVEGLAQALGLELTPSILGGTNYAHGAATSGEGLAEWEGRAVGPNLMEQINLYRDQPNGSELYAVWCGVVDADHTLHGTCVATPERIAENIARAIGALHERGGRYFIVGNAPDFSLFPEYRTGDLRAAASDFCSTLNSALAARLDQIEQLPGIVVYRLDPAGATADLLANPPAGITNTTDAALSGNFAAVSGGGVLVDNPDAYLFWDTVHPGKAWHEALAARAMALIEGRPPAPAAPPALAPGPPRLPAMLDFWLTFLGQATQPGASTGECRY